MGASATIDYSSESIKDRVSVIILWACYWSHKFMYKYMLKYAFCVFIRGGGGGVLPYKRLMGMCRWIGSHFHDWID